MQAGRTICKRKRGILKTFPLILFSTKRCPNDEQACQALHRGVITSRHVQGLKEYLFCPLLLQSIETFAAFEISPFDLKHNLQRSRN